MGAGSGAIVAQAGRSPGVLGVEFDSDTVNRNHEEFEVFLQAGGSRLFGRA